MGDPARSGSQGSRTFRLLRALPWLGLAAVGLALAAGVSFVRVRALAGDLAVAAVGALAGVAVQRAKARRAQRQRRAEPPHGVRLTAPRWVNVDQSAIVLSLGGMLAALPAVFGLSAVSLGVLLTFAVIGIGTPILGSPDAPLALTFADQGLLAEYRKQSTLIAWDAIRAVRPEGPDHFICVLLDVAGRDPLMLMPWTAGLDGLVLARAIERARTPAAGALN